MILRTRGAHDATWTYQEFNGEISLSWSKDGETLEVSNILRDGAGSIAASQTLLLPCFEAWIAIEAGWVEAVPSE